MSLEVVERRMGRSKLSRHIEAILLASGGRAPLVEILRNLRKLGFDTSRLSFEGMGFRIIGGCLEIPGFDMPRGTMETKTLEQV